MKKFGINKYDMNQGYTERTINDKFIYPQFLHVNYLVSNIDYYLPNYLYNRSYIVYDFGNF